MSKRANIYYGRGNPRIIRTVTTLQTTEASEEKKRPPRFLLAMPEDVRLAIERAAFVNGRTVTAEINLRLKSTLKADREQTPADGKGNAYALPSTPTVLHTGSDSDPAGALTVTDKAMLEVFRQLPPEKQLALLSLFK